MRLLISVLLLSSVIAAPKRVKAQQGYITPVSVDPSGSCIGFPPVQMNINTGKLWGCIAGIWQQIGGNGSGSSPGGANTAVQFNNSGAFGGDATNYSYNSSTHQLNVSGGYTSTGPLTITGAHQVCSSVTTPASGNDTLCLDSANSDHLSRKDSSGIVHDIESGSGGGAVAIVGTPTVLGAPAATITISSIPQTGHVLKFYLKGQSDYSGATSDPIVMQFNGDTGAHYTSTKLYGINSGSSGVFCGSYCSSLATNPEAGNIGTTASGGGIGQIDATIDSYADSVFVKSATIIATYQTIGMNTTFNSWSWNPTTEAGVTSITLALASGSNFVTGTMVMATIQ